MKTFGFTVLVLAVGVAAVMALGAFTFTGGAAAAMHGRFFQAKTPYDRNILCEFDWQAAAEPYKGARRVLACVDPWMSGKRGQRTWAIRPTGRARVAWVLANIAPVSSLLGYGRSWTKVGIHCRAARTGLTCRNKSGHGFFLSKKKQRIF